MNTSVHERIRRNPKFQELCERRSRFAWTLSIVMLVAYYAFILVIAFAPGFLGTPLSEGASTTVGIPIGFGVIILCFVLTGIYVRRANSEFDDLNQQILEEAK